MQQMLEEAEGKEMKIEIKKDNEEKEDYFIELNLTDNDMINIKEGHYPTMPVLINGKKYCVSVGYLE